LGLCSAGRPATAAGGAAGGVGPAQAGAGRISEAAGHRQGALPRPAPERAAGGTPLHGPSLTFAVQLLSILLILLWLSTLYEMVNKCTTGVSAQHGGAFLVSGESVVAIVYMLHLPLVCISQQQSKQPTSKRCLPKSLRQERRPGRSSPLGNVGSGPQGALYCLRFLAIYLGQRCCATAQQARRSTFLGCSSGAPSMLHQHLQA
jgi:hypothetical protein